ncbi:uncharacterized protein PV09_09521 [Verruconis gallopava]|uniref:AB hydrolase-1 domain-containing protein n=1 Tax=Verruconis gallopava TaxID=253628 RepID=A0A0D2AIE8_9PEZI|nr:uncharacterized protein PV09_09521 [Verruconis gallopava]KIV98693.1 hypothetical protein PV09_09521 [Verruconis gallopava]
MSTSHFHIQEHKVPCQHIRSYPYATLHYDEEVLHLAVKQYTPLNNPNPQRGDVTIIGAHANGFPKELYEPLWDELLQRSEKQGWRIRGIWIADVAFQGWSGVLNEDKLGCNPGWYDHPRDLLHLINTFRDQMPRPIVGIGHSMGGNTLINLSLMHPRLIETLVLIDPVISRAPSRSGNWGVAAASFTRRDRWPSRRAAEESFKRSKFYQVWDPRVLERWIKYGLRELPTKLYPDPDPKSAATGSTVTPEPTVTPNVTTNEEEKEVTLTTTKHQEVFSFMRTYHPARPGEPRDKVLHPELPLYPDMGSPEPFYRPEPTITFHMLPFLRPTVLYVFGEHSDLSAPEARKDKMEITGTGVGGSGGVKEGKVEEVIIKDTGHLIAMEKVNETATIGAEWIGKRIEEWRQDEETLKRYWDSLPERAKFTMGPEYEEGFKKLGMTRLPKQGNSQPAKL